MDHPARARREADLAAYYDSEVAERSGRELAALRVARRAAFVELLQAEGRRSVLEVGTGPGHDGQALQAAGLAYVGVDLSPETAAWCRSAGLSVQAASVLQLPFRAGSFEAGWSMSTLLHIADEDLDAALTEIVRVLRPGAPLAIGLWGATAAQEGPWGGSEHGPQRFFSLRTDEELLRALARYGALEQWETWAAPTGDPSGVHYQWALLRTAS